MLLLIALMLASVINAATTSNVPYCFFDGCAQASVCRCYSFFQECETSSQAQGYCKLTPWGIAVIVICAVLVVGLFAALFCLLYFCKKIFCCCCKRRRERDTAPMHTTVYYHPTTSHPHELAQFQHQ